MTEYRHWKQHLQTIANCANDTQCNDIYSYSSCDEQGESIIPIPNKTDNLEFASRNTIGKQNSDDIDDTSPASDFIEMKSEDEQHECRAP